MLNICQMFGLMLCWKSGLMECISSVSIVFGPGVRYSAGDCRFDVDDCLRADHIQSQFVVVM